MVRFHGPISKPDQVSNVGPQGLFETNSRFRYSSEQFHTKSMLLSGHSPERMTIVVSLNTIPFHSKFNSDSNSTKNIPLTFQKRPFNPAPPVQRLSPFVCMSPIKLAEVSALKSDRCRGKEKGSPMRLLVIVAMADQGVGVSRD